MILKKPILLIVLSLCGCGVGGSAEADCKITSSALLKASEIRGLKPLKEVPCKLQSKEEIRQFILTTLKKKVPEARLEGEETVYKLLGLIPLDYDYKTGVVDLYTSNLGGYYDPEHDFYAMAKWLPQKLQIPTAVHELVHALQDQYFQIEDLVDPRKYPSDQINAHLALAEGDATAVSLDYAASLQKSPPLEELSEIPSSFFQDSTELGVQPKVKIPAGLKKMLVFPYLSGLRFVHQILKTEGYQGVDAVFRRLPESSEQILHPDLYISGKKGFEEIKSDLPKDYQSLVTSEPFFEDRLGEFFISTLLSELLPADEASVAARGWAGDIVSFYPYIKDRPKSYWFKNEGILTWRSNWDTYKDSREFFHGLGKAYSKRFKVPFNRRPGKYNFADSRVGKVILSLDEKEVLLTIEGS